MRASPLSNLTATQVDVLRDLIAVAFESAPALAQGEALAVAAVVEAEVLHRHLDETAERHADHPGLPIRPGELVIGLSDAVSAIRPEVTSTTKWAPVAELLARALGVSVNAVYVSGVGGLSRNIAVRLAQSRKGRDAAVAVVMWTPGAEPLSLALAATTRACQEIPRLHLIFTIDRDRAELAAIITPPTLPAPTALLAAYPAAQTLRADPPAATPPDA